ncbi:MAG: imidazoleglycerol-phosphate dehydratase, partial [Hyphomicrobium sp.]
MKRQATISRNTKETDITATVDLDGSGQCDVTTGIGFLDHMLEQLARHSM